MASETPTSSSTGSHPSEAPSNGAPVPLLGQGHPVDWWFAFKFNADRYPGRTKTADEREGIFGGTLEDYDDQAEDAKRFSQAYCFASSSSPTLIQGEGAIGTTLDGPVGATFGQVYDGSFFYALWNDQFYDNPMRTEGAPHGHSKGVIAWDEAGEGFVMQVSTPSWPASGSRQYPRQNDGNTLGYINDDDVEVSQHFFCLQLTSGDVAEVLKALINAKVATEPDVPALVQKGGPPEIATLVDSLGSPPATTSCTRVELSTGVQLISKPADIQVPPWQLVSAQLGGVPLRVASWWAHPKIYSTTRGQTLGCWKPELGQAGDVEIATTGTWDGRQFSLLGGSGLNFNHAKFAVSKDPGTPYTIFGDMNQQGALSPGSVSATQTCASSQNGRGGTFYALTDQGLWTSVTALLVGDSAPTSPPA